MCGLRGTAGWPQQAQTLSGWLPPAPDEDSPSRRQGAYDVPPPPSAPHAAPWVDVVRAGNGSWTSAAGAPLDGPLLQWCPGEPNNKWVVVKAGAGAGAASGSGKGPGAGRGPLDAHAADGHARTPMIGAMDAAGGSLGSSSAWPTVQAVGGWLRWAGFVIVPGLKPVGCVLQVRRRVLRAAAAQLSPAGGWPAGPERHVLQRHPLLHLPAGRPAGLCA
jgi:hypothetical protein